MENRHTKEGAAVITPQRRLEARLRKKGLTYGSSMVITLTEKMPLTVRKTNAQGEYDEDEIHSVKTFNGSIVGIEGAEVIIRVNFGEGYFGKFKLNIGDIKNIEPYLYQTPPESA